MNTDLSPDVLVLLTGGETTMKKNERGVYEIVPLETVRILMSNLQTHDSDFAKRKNLGDTLFALPTSESGDRIIYKVKEYTELKDSSNISIEDWEKIAQDIKNEYERYKGFVVLHGTDTIAYTASALSFMMHGLTKPVILTTSRFPVSEQTSKCFDNLINALNICCYYQIQEVAILYEKVLFRGNRVTIFSSDDQVNFESPNYPPLAYGSKFSASPSRERNLTPNDERRHVQFQTTMSKNVGILRLFPGVTSRLINNFMNSGLEGIVLQTYGAGNIASENKEVLEEIRQACAQGVIIVNCSQCSRGSVSLTYATNTGLQGVGVLSGGDMTTEAAFAKLSFVLAQEGLLLEEKKRMMITNISGELSS